MTLREAAHRGTAACGLRRAVCAAFALLLILLDAAAPTAAAAEERPSRQVLTDVFPEAERFGAFEGEPPAVPAYRDGQVVGYVLRTQEVVASAGFSGKPLDVAVGLNLEGRITGARILEHHEPILIIGVSPADLEAFVESYRGFDIRTPLKVTRRPSDEPGTVDAVMGATVSSAVINDAILQAARAVARAHGIIEAPDRRLDIDSYEAVSWDELVSDGSLQSLDLEVGAVAERLARRNAQLYPEGAGPDNPQATFVELYAALATPARIGRNLLGDRAYSRAMAKLTPGDQLLFIAGRGLYSFKGTAFVRTGVFDRIQVVQGDKTLTLRRENYTRIDEVETQRAPELRELALFTVPVDSGFDPLKPWRLELLVGGERTHAAGTVYTSFVLPYRLPDRYVLASAGADAGKSDETPLWVQRWEDRKLDVAILTLALVALTALLILQDMITQRPRLHRYLRYGFLAFTLLWIGWYAEAQLSVLNVLTFLEALRTEFRWDFFLLEPLLFILWSYVAVAMLFWGRGVFCGWLCPFGALQELLNKGARQLRVPQVKIPFLVNERLWPIKYVIFIALLAASLGPMALAQTWVEVEPFKTAIVLRFAREWPFVAYALGILAVGLFIERFFCRYICPLGGALAIPARLRMFEWLKRRPQCGTQCNICAARCPVQAIHRSGHINPNECIYCLDCQDIMYDNHICPPLLQRRQRYEQRMAARQKARETAAQEQAVQQAQQANRPHGSAGGPDDG